MSLDKDKAVALLNQIMELELASVVRYTHYALMVYGYNRIPIVEWLNKQADEGLLHARKAGELVTFLGGHPSFAIGPLLETHLHDTNAACSIPVVDILQESLANEAESLKLYYQLLELAQGKSVVLEDYARNQIMVEEMHADAVRKMLRQPCEV
ncbi:bacterioferritin [Nitrosomonas sp. Is37]|uniref:ferritin-like domain-containing protein n=1 Tax=Nitrosomonas sp. Is37 TaxID=3080535 RepID=UPI00294B094B|nr:ferritin-like domain-containing protein [Nitrosomonas sp. Is37]MDV6344963.1 ferritin-like domain-containing protein [Nitrosomonas sp. Is37]